MPASRGAPSPFGPLANPAFRMLWTTALAANISMWMSDVASAWLMTSFTQKPIWVALVQTASTVPVFLFGLPSGALADILDRRRYLLATQCWLLASATLLCLAVAMGAMTPTLLLQLTFINGIGLAMRWPVYGALVPEAVPRAQLAQGMALNGVAMNASRIVGPLLAGAMIATLDIAWVFALNAAIAALTAVAVLRWKRAPLPSPLGQERLWPAIRVGLQFVRQSPSLQGLLLRVLLYFIHTSAVLALLPLLARRMGGDAGTFSLLLSSMGAGAITVALLMPWLRLRLAKAQLLTAGVVMQACTATAMAMGDSLLLGMPAMFIMGMAWLGTANSLGVSVQATLPNWVRARGMSVYQMCITGGGALGAALWGQVATLASLRTALLAAAVSGLLSLLLMRRLAGELGAEEDLSSAGVLRLPMGDASPVGQVVVSVEYRIDPASTPAFLAVMEESRRSRLRQGARSWTLLNTPDDPGRFVEQIMDESWTEHLRRVNRFNVADAALRERRLAFHRGDSAPEITRFVMVHPHQ